MPKPLFIDRATLARLIGCGIGTLDAMVLRGELPKPMQLTKGARIRFIRSELEPALLAQGIDLCRLEAIHAPASQPLTRRKTMPKPTQDHGPLCGHILSHAPELTEQQKTILLDALDGLTEADLQTYSARKAELAKIPLDAKGERTMLHVLRQLGAVAGSPVGVLHFNQQIASRFETDC